jgi:hypothetical protein
MQHRVLFIVISYKFTIKADNMKKFVLSALALVLVVAGYGQSDDSRDSRQVSGFHGVQVSGGIDLYLSSGQESVAVTASTKSTRDHMITEVVNGILRIHLEENWHPDAENPKMKAYVTISTLDQLHASGGSDIYIQNEIKTGDLTVRLSGGGSLKGKLNANHLVISQSGGSNVDLSGNVQNLEVDASGGANLHGYDLVTDYTRIHASGGCSSQLTVYKELYVVASGGCDIYYKGSASVKEIKTSGGGSVTHKD